MNGKVIVIVLALLLCLPARAGHLVLRDTLRGSDIYPGTEHALMVCVPDGYRGDRPGCLYVGLDGLLCNAPAVIDSLMAAGKMPVTVSVLLQPGVVRDGQGRVVRYNRSNEFDATDGRFAAFLETEVLPRVEQLVTPDGRQVRLSHDANDRMIFGLSSGGIAAFTAAWQRPDLFSRVFSGCGTFVAMRGGNDLQALVRKTEPLPLRVFLQDGYDDAWNALFGHWYEGNRMLASALEFAGYDCAHDWAEGGHSVRRANQIFAQVMEWMWRDWPQPVKAGTTQNNFLQPLLISGEGWHDVGAAVTSAAGDSCVAWYPDSSLVAVWKPGSDCLTQYTCQNGRLANGQPFYWLHRLGVNPLQVSGMAFDGNGNLWVLTSEGLQVCDQNGRVRGILRLPGGKWRGGRIVITDGQVLLPAYGKVRRLRVKAPTAGVRPKSQGQG